jgi:hypothetical protein
VLDERTVLQESNHFQEYDYVFMNLRNEESREGEGILTIGDGLDDFDPHHLLARVLWQLEVMLADRRRWENIAVRRLDLCDG